MPHDAAKKIEKEDGYLALRDFLLGTGYKENTKYLVLNTPTGPQVSSIILDETSAKCAENFRKDPMKGKIEYLYITLKRFCDILLGEFIHNEVAINMPEMVGPVGACIWEMLMWNTEGNESREASLIRSSDVCFIDAKGIYEKTDTLSSSDKPLFTLAHTKNLLFEPNEQLSFSF